MAMTFLFSFSMNFFFFFPNNFNPDPKNYLFLESSSLPLELKFPLLVQFPRLNKSWCDVNVDVDFLERGRQSCRALGQRTEIMSIASGGSVQLGIVSFLRIEASIENDNYSYSFHYQSHNLLFICNDTGIRPHLSHVRTRDVITLIRYTRDLRIAIDKTRTNFSRGITYARGISCNRAKFIVGIFRVKKKKKNKNSKKME